MDKDIASHKMLYSDQAVAYRAKCIYMNLIEEFDEDTAKSLLTAAMPEIYKEAQSHRYGVPADYKPTSRGTTNAEKRRCKCNG
ncbi:hypothetical protein SAMN05661091_4157 [Paenibacillus uliginis N3/975]|uniref:Uncharacterized protein n=1 Tax=Paenibacillus uliginis N3/975 TaxID=1313296 RepID=A0A1X7HLC1_9BACL|nr:hypothetical protein [Paenibacillus uliginis]SMF88179.1 hypothetical protein SAMN05661091_4157 [Paenibacillus uliginis N3/975]